MARFPALATSLAVHAVAFVLVVLVPIFGNEPLPETTPAKPPIDYWPVRPPVVFADSRPAPARGVTAARATSAGPSLAQLPSTPLAVTKFDSTTEPADSGADVGESSLTSGTGSADCCGTGMESNPGGGAGEGSAGAPFHVGGHIRPPTKLRHVKPEYPELARRARITGAVVLKCLIDVTGRVTEIHVISGHLVLAPAAAGAVAQWLYSPTELNGRPVPVLLTVTVRFDLGR